MIRAMVHCEKENIYPEVSGLQYSEFGSASGNYRTLDITEGLTIFATDEQLKNIANAILKATDSETYDEVVEELKKEQDRVGHLLNQVAELENKIEELEGEE